MFDFGLNLFLLHWPIDDNRLRFHQRLTTCVTVCVCFSCDQIMCFELKFMHDRRISNETTSLIVRERRFCYYQFALYFHFHSDKHICYGLLCCYTSYERNFSGIGEKPTYCGNNITVSMPAQLQPANDHFSLALSLVSLPVLSRIAITSHATARRFKWTAMCARARENTQNQ